MFHPETSRDSFRWIDLNHIKEKISKANEVIGVFKKLSNTLRKNALWSI